MIVQIRDLKFKYASDSSPNLLDIPFFVLEKGEKVFLYGPSGCGKTTFLEIIAGVMVPQSGQVLISGSDITQMTPGERDLFRANLLGYIFQNFNLIPYLNVLENITLPLYLSPKKRLKVSTQDEKSKALELCHSLGLENYIAKNVTELSVGQQQRVAAARAILGAPELIVADEPTSSLDYDHRERFIELLFKLCQEHQISLLFVSHERSLQKLFDRSLSLTEINNASQSQKQLLL